MSLVKVPHLENIKMSKTISMSQGVHSPRHQEKSLIIVIKLLFET